VSQLINWQRRQGHEPHLALGRDSEIASIPEDVEIHWMAHLVRDPSPLRDLQAGRALATLIHRGRFDAVHTHQSKAGVLGRLAARGAGCTILHSIYLASFGPGYSPAASLTFANLERYCARHTDLLVCVGDGLRRQYLSAGVGRPQQYRVIRSPVDSDRFLATRSLATEERAGLRAMLGLPPDKRLIAAAGVFEPRKRFDLMIRALSPLLRAGAYRLVIAGDGVQMRALQRLTERLGVYDRVRFLGWARNLPEVFAASDLFVHTSAAEGLPQVVIQALAAGLPVVSTLTAGLDELPGAPIAVVPATAAGLVETVERVSRWSPRPVLAAAAFTPWATSSIESGYELLAAEIVAMTAARRATSTAGGRP